MFTIDDRIDYEQIEETAPLEPAMPSFEPESRLAETPEPPRTDRRPGAWRSVVLSFVSAVVGGLVVLGALAGYSSLQPEKTSPVIDGFSGNRPVVTKPTGQLLAPQDIYDTYGPAVVQISATVTGYSQDFFGVPYPESGQAEGSGFVVDGNGYIVTNAHVVDNANEVSVTLTDKTKLKAKVAGIDRSSDLALLKINPSGKKLSVINLGDSSRVRVGDTVFAIGNPFGHLPGSMTSGIVSAIGRPIEAPNGFTIQNVIQTDAAVNPGNSGGPLIDAYGQVVGVNAQIEAKTEQFAGVAFAIPSNTVKTIVDQLKAKGKASHAWLGIQGSDVTSELADKYELKTTTGVLITAVINGSPAEQAGLRGVEQTPTGIVMGDILVEFDGSKVGSMSDLLSLVEQRKVGEKIKLVVLRANKKETITITLDERPADLERRN
ncbi:MAG: S1C family serine protease [Candidatus Aquicultorales bacterium]